MLCMYIPESNEIFLQGCHNLRPLMITHLNLEHFLKLNADSDELKSAQASSLIFFESFV